MKAIRWFACATLVLSAAAHAEGFGVAAHAGSLGYGLDLNTRLADNFSGRFGFDYYKYSKSLTKDSIDYDASFKWQTAHLLADWYPWRGVFRATFGVVHNGNKLTLKATPGSQTVVIGGTSYTATDLGSLAGEMSFRSAAPYLGIGWGNPVAPGKGWGFVADIGALYQGWPQVTLKATCAAGSSLCSQLQNSTAIEQVKLDNDLQSFKWYPVASIGFSYQF